MGSGAVCRGAFAGRGRSRAYRSLRCGHAMFLSFRVRSICTPVGVARGQLQRLRHGDRPEFGRRAQEGRPEPDAPGLLDQLNNLNETDNPFLFTGTSVKNTPNDHYSITQEYIARYDAAANDGKPITQPIDVRGQIKFP